MANIVAYDEVNATLMALHAGILAAECHGFLCGYFCATNTLATETWQDYLLADIDKLADSHDCMDTLVLLARQVCVDMQADDASFALLLPDDESTINERARAVAAWSAGFVSGLGIGSVGEKPALMDECDEFVKDVIAISRMETGVEESENAERMLFEITEYIRVGVIMLHQAWHHADSARSEVLH